MSVESLIRAGEFACMSEAQSVLSLIRKFQARTGVGADPEALIQFWADSGKEGFSSKQEVAVVVYKFFDELVEKKFLEKSPIFDDNLQVSVEGMHSGILAPVRCSLSAEQLALQEMVAKARSGSEWRREDLNLTDVLLHDTAELGGEKAISRLNGFVAGDPEWFPIQKLLNARPHESPLLLFKRYRRISEQTLRMHGCFGLSDVEVLRVLVGVGGGAGKPKLCKPFRSHHSLQPGHFSLPCHVRREILQFLSLEIARFGAMVPQKLIYEYLFCKLLILDRRFIAEARPVGSEEMQLSGVELLEEVEIDQFVILEEVEVFGIGNAVLVTGLNDFRINGIKTSTSVIFRGFIVCNKFRIFLTDNPTTPLTLRVRRLSSLCPKEFALFLDRAGLMGSKVTPNLSQQRKKESPVRKMELPKPSKSFAVPISEKAAFVLRQLGKLALLRLHAKKGLWEDCRRILAQHFGSDFKERSDWMPPEALRELSEIEVNAVPTKPWSRPCKTPATSTGSLPAPRACTAGVRRRLCFDWLEFGKCLTDAQCPYAHSLED